MNLSAPFINRPIMTTFVVLALAIAGWMGFRHLSVSDLPTIEHPHLHVSTGYTGASPEVILNEVTIPLEKELAHVKGIQNMVSTSSSGHSSITLKFDLSKDMNEAIRDVQGALSRAKGVLPLEVDWGPTYERQEGNQEPILYIVMTSDNSNVSELREYADAYVVPRLSRVEGVAQVLTFGAKKSIWVRLNPEMMAARQIGINQVTDTIRKYTAQRPLGTIQTSTKTLSIEVPASIQQAKDLENLKIGDTSVRLRDIGEVSEKSTLDQEFYFLTSDTKTAALILGIQKVSDANTVAISKAVRENLKTLSKELPSSIHLDPWFDKAVWIEESIHDVEWSLLFAFGLVVLVIYLSLGRLSEALIPSVALPLSLAGTFAVMYLLNFSLDLLSLLALTLSVGFVVDDAIVVLENIVRHQEEGAEPREASLQGSKQICFTILSMTLSLVAVFIPLIFLGGMNGRLFREFSITLAVAILVSGFISLSLTPMMCSRFLPKKMALTDLQLAVKRVNDWLVGLYGKGLKYCLRYPKTVLITAFLCVSVTIPLFMQLPVNLIPPEDRGFLFAFVKLPSGSSNTEVKKYQEKLEKIFQTNPHMKNFLSISFEGNLVYVGCLNPISQRPPQKAVIADLQKEFDAVPGTLTFIKGCQLIDIDFDWGRGGQYQYVLRGQSYQDVEKTTMDLTAAFQADPDFSFVQSSLKNESPKLVVTVDDELAHRFGVNKLDVQELLQRSYSQGQAGSIQKWTGQEKIYVELQEKYQNQPDVLAKLYLNSNTGTLVPLKAVASWEERLGAQSLLRHEQQPAATIRFSLVDSVSPGSGLEKVEDITARQLSSTVTGSWDGTAKMSASMLKDTLLLLVAASVVMYIVLGILYESFIHPLTILSSLPFASLGGVLTLFLFGEPVSIFSAVGFLLLIGIVKKNGIMMIDYALEAQKQGISSEQAIYEGCLVRFRPIMMTTIAAIMGAVPIAIGFGDGANMRRGLGLVIVGGLLFSQVLTLYVTPVLYLAFEKLESKSKKLSLKPLFTWIKKLVCKVKPVLGLS